MFNGCIEVELIAIFNGRFQVEEDDCSILSFYFTKTMLLNDYEKGEIEGYKYNEDTIFFKYEYDADIDILEISDKENLEILESLQRGDVITFKARIGIESEFDKYSGDIQYRMITPFTESSFSMWDVTRLSDKSIADRMRALEYEALDLPIL